MDRFEIAGSVGVVIGIILGGMALYKNFAAKNSGRHAPKGNDGKNNGKDELRPQTRASWDEVFGEPDDK